MKPISEEKCPASVTVGDTDGLFQVLARADEAGCRHIFHILGVTPYELYCASHTPETYVTPVKTD